MVTGLCNITEIQHYYLLLLILIFLLMFIVLLLQAGSIEGQVVEMGLTTTSLLNAEKFPVIVPNSLFSSQVGTYCLICHFKRKKIHMLGLN